MDASRSKRRRQRAKQLLRQRSLYRRAHGVIGKTQEAVTHAYVIVPRSLNLQRELMKRASSGPGIKGRVVRTIADQVVAFLIFQDATDPPTQIVGISDGDTTCLSRQKIETLLGFEGSVTAVG